MNDKKIPVIAVVGPTASGKTRYAVTLARQVNTLLGNPRAEIISADSRQVYRGMDIGTGKDLGEYEDIPYHLMDIVNAGEKYNIFEYQRDFEKAYKDIRERGCIPILCGGSGLYIEAATCGYSITRLTTTHGKDLSVHLKSPSMRPDTRYNARHIFQRTPII